MNRLFSRLNVRRQLIVILGIMVAAILVFSGIVISRQWNLYEENTSLSNLVEFSIKSSALVHEIQKERGMTAGFMKSRGNNFATELPKQRQSTDTTKESFLAFLDESDVRNASEEISGEVDNILEGIKEIPDVRKRVDSFSIGVGNAVGFYTSLNGKILATIASSQKLSKEAEILRQLSTYVNFLQGKERAGIERAVGAGGFGAGFSNKDITKFNKLITIQDTYFNVFRTTALPGQIEFFQESMSSDEAKEVERLRDVARRSLDTGHVEGVSASHWFKTITKKINSLKDMEDKLSKDLYEAVTIKKDSAFDSFRFFSLKVLATFAVIIYLAYGFASNLTSCFSSLSGALKRGAEGDFAGRIENIKSHGEMRDVQERYNDFVDQVDGFFKQMFDVLSSVAKGDYEKSVPSDGFAGSFASSANNLNEVVSEMKKKDDDLKDLLGNLERTIQNVNTIVGETSGMTQKMSTASADMMSLSSSSAEKSNEVDGAASRAQESVTTIASAIEEMSASVSEIASQTANSTKIVSEAQKEVDNVSGTVEKFGSEVENIGNVVELISGIAEQINLLALNATIESARAGEAGKGFAVVASEVKNLAGQTAKATEEIANQISSIQVGSVDIVNGMRNISETMVKVAEISGSVGAAVEEQSAVTQEISSSMQTTSQNADNVKNNIATIKSSLQETASSASNVSDMTQKVSENVEKLGAELKSVSGA